MTCRRLGLVTLIVVGLAWNAEAENPLGRSGVFIEGEAGVEIRDTGLPIAATDLTIPMLYHSCQRPRWMPEKNWQRRWFEEKGWLVTADDIPVANTPGCGYDAFPPAVLSECNEPLAAGVPDMRGLWVTVAGVTTGHVERIEQCGNRVVITSAGVIHDMRADGTLANGVNDVTPPESISPCREISVSAEFVEGRLELKPFNLFVAVTRELDGEDLIWRVLDNENRLVKICGGASPKRRFRRHAR